MADSYPVTKEMGMDWQLKTAKLKTMNQYFDSGSFCMFMHNSSANRCTNACTHTHTHALTLM